MNIGLVDVDGHNFPNLALMKLSAWHKAQGDNVEFADPLFGNYDRVYQSKVFTFSTDYQYGFDCEVIKAGTGYKDYSTILPEAIEHICPDYDLYKSDGAIGFLTRGCPNKCKWCIVPHKEGIIRPNADIEEFIGDKKSAILLDNNVLASDFGLSQIEKIVNMGIKVDFNQGLDARIASQDKGILKLLSQVKWLRYIRFACDTVSQIDSIVKCVEGLNRLGVKPYRIFVYVLVKDVNDALLRLHTLKALGVSPFAQPYRDFENKIMPTKEQKDVARWCNHRAIFHTIDFNEYNKL